MNGAGRPAHLPGISATQSTVMAGRRAGLRQDHSAPCRTGVGDTLQFIRYAPLLAGQGAKVVCEVQPELLPLLSENILLKDITVMAAGEPRPAFDLHCPMLSLPLAFGTEPEIIPAAIPYLAAPAERQTYWRNRVAPGRLRAGFVWSGQASHKNDSNRSIALPRLSALFENPQVRCFSLQRDLREADAKALRDLPNLVHLGDDVRDFADTAAVISLLDIVVSVDTAVAHLAGALGKPVMILLPFAADFRWMRIAATAPGIRARSFTVSRPSAIGTA